jgi:hypothetical protein
MADFAEATALPRRHRVARPGSLTRRRGMALLAMLALAVLLAVKIEFKNPHSNGAF